MRIFTLTFVVILLFLQSTQAQKTPFFQFPKGIPKPCWVDKVNWNKPNLFEIEALIKSCPEIKSAEEKLREAEEGEVDKLDEEPYRIALKRWLDGNNIFIQPNGSIIVNDDSAKALFRRSIDNQKLYHLQRKQLRTNSTLGINALVTSTGTANWTALGPSATYESGAKKSWQANIYSFAIAPSNSNILYCGSETGILFKSTDKGLNWFSVSDALIRNAPTAIAVDPTNANTVYAALKSPTGLIKSIDGGVNWTSLSTFTGGFTNHFAINPVTGRILTASANGIYYSNDGGSTWSKSTTSVTPGAEIFDIALNPSDPSIVYAVTAINTSTTDDMVLFRSTDGGSTFSFVTLPAATYCTGARFGVSPANGNYVYCITLQNDVPKLLLSTDNGSTWISKLTFLGTGLTGSNSTNGMSNGQGFYDLGIMVSPSDINQIILGTTTAYKSIDGGANFTPLGGYYGAFSIHPDVQSMVALGNDSYITTDGGVNYSSDFFTSTTNFDPRNSGITASENWGFGQGWSEDILVSGRYHNGNGALYESFGNGNALRLGGGEDATGHVFQIPGKSGITGFRDLGNSLKQLPASTSGSRTDAPFTNTLWPTETGYGKFSSELVQDPRYANIFYVGNGNSLYKSENYGLNYTELKNFASAIWRIEISRSNPSYIYTTTTGGIYRSTDGGTTWNTLTLPGGVTYQYYNTDIAVNPENEQEVFVCMALGATANKVFRSVNGGSTWTNYTGTLLSGKAVAFLQAQGGTNSGVYAILNTSPAKVYYRDASMSDWIDYSAGLPNNVTAGRGALLFYRDNKLRLSGNRGHWETPLYSSSKPQAMPMANKRYVSCSRDTVIFKDYSILEYQGASWEWSFPGASYVSSSTNSEVKVTYPGIGNYSVTLKVTDAKGNTNSKTIQNMISFTADNCPLDFVAGKALRLNFDKKVYSIGTAAINSNTFTISCWIRPDGLQKSFSQLIAHDPYPGSSYGLGLGFTFSSYAPNLRLCYTDGVVGYSNATGAYVDTSKWNHVALVYAPTGVTIYLNGVAYAARTATMAAIDLSLSPFYINRDIHGQNGDFKGEIDEIKIYNYALTQGEIREKMHLINSSGLSETGLLKYVQFNVLDANNNSVYELVNGTSIQLPSAGVLFNSTAPIGNGLSSRKTVTTGGQNSFNGTGVDLFFATKGGITLPNGEIVAFKLNALPSILPESPNALYAGHSIIINNYGTNTTFTPLDSIRLNNLQLPAGYTSASAYKLYKRSSFALETAAWGNSLANGIKLVMTGAETGTLTFPGNNISSFSQFVISVPTICNIAPSTINSDVSIICEGSTANLSLSQSYDNTQYQFQWYAASSSGGTYSSVGTNSALLMTGPLTATTYFKCVISCASSPTINYTTPEIAVIVNANPVILQQPSTVLERYCYESVALPLTISADPGSGSIVKYEWYGQLSPTNSGGTLEDVQLISETISSYTPSTLLLDTLYHYAVVTNSNGCTTTSNLSGLIEIIPAPKITIQPNSNDVTYCMSNNATPLTVTAMGPGVLTNQWYSNTVPVKKGGLPINGANSASYIPPTTTTGTTYYYVEVDSDDGCNTISNVSGAINVVSSAMITQQPSVAAASYCSGAAASVLTVMATANNVITYQWYSNTSASTSGGILIAGATTSSYTPPTTVAGTSYYYVKLNPTDICPVTSSLSGPITVNPVPSISTQPSITAYTLCQGATATNLNITVYGNGISKYDWYRNTTNSNIGGTLVVTNFSNSTSNSYIPSTSQTGLYYYYVVVSNNSNCSVKSNISGSYTINVTPVITVQPTTINKTYCLNTTADKLFVTANVSSGLLSYQWYSNTTSATSGGTLIKGATAASYTPPTNATGRKYYYVIINPASTCKVTSVISGAIVVNALPSSPSAIAVTGGTSKSGTLSVCPISTTTYQYTASAVTGAAGYKWTLPGCGTGSSTSNIIGVKYSGIRSTDSIKVQTLGSNGCYSTVRGVKVTSITTCTPTCTITNTLTKTFSKVGQVSEQSKFQVHIHPNPTRNSFQLSVETKEKDLIWLQITDIQGRILMDRKYMPNKILQVGAEWPSGLYLFKFQQRDVIKTWKAIKQ